MQVLRVGCPMWTHRAWPGSGLATYVTWCNAVEGNTTFYALPAPAVAASWAERMPAEFRMVCKLPREITHERRLRDVSGPLARFVGALEPLGDRAQQWTVQLPAAFDAGDLGALDALLQMLPGDRHVGVEVRHPDFFVDGPRRTGLLRTLERHGADLVTLDSRVLFSSPPTSDAERDAWAKKPRLPVLDTAIGSHPVVRVIGRDDEERTNDAVRAWLPTVLAWLAEGRTPTVFVHTPDNEASPRVARRFHEWVRAERADLAPLPDPEPMVTPTQQSLFE